MKMTRCRVGSISVIGSIAMFVVSMTAQAQAPKKTEVAAPSSSCSRNGALEIIRQQIDVTKTFDNTVQRIAVLIRAADVLWPYQQDKARAAFTEAFELAKQNFKEAGDDPKSEGRFVLVTVPDQRYTVINAIAKRDIAWARKLIDQILKDQQREAEEKPTKNTQQKIRTAEKLLAMANSLLSSDQAAALGFAANSLGYPATMSLPFFLYSLAPINRSAADQLYQEALAAYANAPMDRLLYLSSYPFGNDREVGDMPGYMIYRVPAGFQPSPGLQRMFLQTLLRRVQQLIDNPADSASGSRVSEPEQMWLALTRLEKQVQQSLPDLAPSVEQARGAISAQLSESLQRNVTRMISDDNAPKRTFDEQVEAAEKNPNVDRRDQELSFAVIHSTNESLERLLAVVDKISDSSVRAQLLNWIYFTRTGVAVKDQKLDEARKLAAKVEELDQRAYLYFRIAEESLKQNADQTQAREMLDEVVSASVKAPATMVTARALLGVAYLYSKIDVNRAIAVVGDAVKCINRLETPDFSRQYVMRKIEGKTFGSVAAFVTPGFSPENALREVGKLDFDGCLYQASNFTDKSLRSSTTLALADLCLQQTQQPKPERTNKKTKPAAPPDR